MTEKTNQTLNSQFFEFFTKKDATTHLNELLTTYLNSPQANNLNDRQKKLFFAKKLKKIIKNLSD